MSSEVDSENLLSGEGYDDAGNASPSLDVNIMDSDRPGTSDYFEPSYKDAAFELRARVRNQVRADIRRDLNLLSSPKLAPAVDVPSIALDYTFRSWTQFMDPAGSGKGQYGTNIGNIVISSNQGAVRGAHLEDVAGGSWPADGEKVSSHATDDIETAVSGEEEEEDDEEAGDSILESQDNLPALWSDGEDVTSLCEQVVSVQNLNEEPDSDLEDEKYRKECLPPTGSKTINLFRELIWLKRYQKKSGWWSFYTRAGKMTVYPKLSNCHGWEIKFYWLRVPSDFPLRTQFSVPRPHMEHYPDRELGFREKRAYRFVSYNRVDTGLHTLDFPKLGLGKNGRPTTNIPANPRGVFSTISTYSSTANRKRSLVREEPVTESPVKKTRALNSIPAPKPISIRDPTSRSTASWGVHEPPRQPFSGVQSAVGEQTDAAMQKVSDIPVEKVADAGVLVSTEVPIVQNDATIVDIKDTPSHHEDREVNNTDAGILDNILIPPPTHAAQSAYMRPGQSAGTSSGLHMGLFVRPEEWIETTPVVLTPNKMKYFEVPPGNPDEPWDPKIDLLRGESILTDDCRFGGCMGWRALKGLATPRETPAVKIDAPAAQHMNDVYKKKQSDEDYAKIAAELETVKQRNLDLENVSSELDAERKKTADLTAQLEDADVKIKEAYRKGAKDGALRFSRSKTYCKRVTDRHNGGWFAAHRCVVHGIGLTEEECLDIEDAFLVDKKHKNPTGFESQIIPEEIIQNADPSTLPPIELQEEDYLDPEFLSSSTNQAGQKQV
ncbi:hypothetical protein SOVF_005930 [Spinacia oleracea]|nr:hypothetical protein SOVF_005930 [Spinacia oleracea]